MCRARGRGAGLRHRTLPSSSTVDGSSCHAEKEADAAGSSKKLVHAALALLPDVRSRLIFILPRLRVRLRTTRAKGRDYLRSTAAMT